MRSPFLGDLSPDEPPPPPERPVWLALLPVLLYVLAAISFLALAMRVPNIVAAALFVTAAIVSLGAGLMLGLSLWLFPELPR
ncbi:hypothetical protein GmRootV59_41680 [Variovorax sp. V59]|uniref:Uncharacterized protein n=1 Tax=Variovorax paradoxus TaxID=34073 RepID=A0AAE3XZL8_VARPD|nr:MULTISPECIES: hypothetical protein [Variovorax]MBD9662672.1 hypothetical protein [Variovorax sp. VRV01]MDP9967879.1 hypothetical protein [Variovorax paradoxus]MDR6427184.1 hypothetical protein [Variovorax paradoxus]